MKSRVQPGHLSGSLLRSVTKLRDKSLTSNWANSTAILSNVPIFYHIFKRLVGVLLTVWANLNKLATQVHTGVNSTQFNCGINDFANSESNKNWYNYIFDKHSKSYEINFCLLTDIDAAV